MSIDEYTRRRGDQDDRQRMTARLGRGAFGTIDEWGMHGRYSARKKTARQAGASTNPLAIIAPCF